LRDYYDPMYDYQLSQKEGRILVRGGPQALTDWANAHSGT
ncbi:MAG: tRNA 2-selenouridine(34) synthase MnmH, partial [Pseudomonadota bacterium]|nr:tRNA 2-selenouridine(34) synthase MnmH [Pseudomonadota bacterium]